MKSERDWKPSKFVITKRGLRGSRDPLELNVSSRIAADAMASHYQAAIERHARGDLLDLGCGKAPLYAVYRPLVDSVTCADRAQSPHGVDYVDLECDLEEPLPLPDASFDTVVATDVLEHLADPFLFWREASRVIRPGGHLILGVPFMYWLHEEPHDHYRFTSFRLERFCREFSFECVQLESYGGSIAVVLDLIGKHVRPRLLSSIFQAIGNIVLRRMHGIDRATSTKFPLGYVLVARRVSGDSREEAS